MTENERFSKTEEGKKMIERYTDAIIEISRSRNLVKLGISEIVSKAYSEGFKEGQENALSGINEIEIKAYNAKKEERQRVLDEVEKIIEDMKKDTKNVKLKMGKVVEALF